MTDLTTTTAASGTPTATADAEPAPARLLPALGRALPLLVGMTLLMVGTGLTSTLLGIRAGLEGFSPSVIGVVLSAYYGGFVVGSLVSPSMIRRVGHIRAFAGLASLASAAVLVHVVWPDPFSWLLLRALSGVCLSGLFVVTETWLNGAASNVNRGSLLSAYMVVVAGGAGVGQLLLLVASPAGFGAFVLASVLVSLAVVPVSFTAVSPPDVPDPTPLSWRETVTTAPLAIVGAAGAGFVAAAMLATGAVYAAQAGLSTESTGVLLATTLALAVAAQFPLGRVSDRVDRRLVILALAMGGTILGAAAATVGSARFLLLLPFAAVAGGLAFPLYSLSSAHLNDYLNSSAVAAAGARMVLVNGAGAVAGPIVAAAAIGWAGPDAFFVVVAACYGAIAAYCALRLTRRGAVAADQRAHFVPYPLGTAPTVATLAPEAAAELYPAASGTLEAAGARLRWWERGTGWPVVIVHDAGSSSAGWDRVALALAATGHRVVAWDLRGHGESGPGRAYGVEAHLADLTAVLSDRGLPVATLVGHGSGAAIAAAFGGEHPERVDGIVLVAAGDSVARAERRPVRVLERAVEGAVRAALGDPAPSLPGPGGPFRRRPPEHRRVLAADRQRARPEAVVGTRRSVRQSVTADSVGDLQMPTLRARGPGEPGLGGPEGEVVLAGTGHFIHLEQPDALADAILDFTRVLHDRAHSAHW